MHRTHLSHVMNGSTCSTRGRGTNTEGIGAGTSAYISDQVDNITNSAAGARAIR
jgi:hypothetical protein